MRLWLFLLLVTGLAQAVGAAPTSTESGVVSEVNLLRTQPRTYAQFLREYRAFYQGDLVIRPGRPALRTKEGVAAVDEAITFLEQQVPIGPLQYSVGMSWGALDHVKDQAVTGATGHPGADNSLAPQRVGRYGVGKGVGENIMYGSAFPRDIVMQLVIDDAVPDRGHRVNFFRPDYQMIGVACGTHPRYRTSCVITMAMDFVEDKAQRPPPSTYAEEASPTRPNTTGAANTTLPKTPLMEARGVAEANLRACLGQDREAWMATLSKGQRTYASSSWRKVVDATRGATFTYGCTEKTSTSLKKFRYLRNINGKITPYFMTVILESGRWLVDETTE